VPLSGGGILAVDMGGRKIRYRIHITSDQWQETGEMSTDGESWNQFFETSLERH